METSPGNDDSTKNIEKIIKLTKKKEGKTGSVEAQWPTTTTTTTTNEPVG